jgi:predicted enzyme related to lactoylglutathione lyase
LGLTTADLAADGLHDPARYADRPVDAYTSAMTSSAMVAGNGHDPDGYDPHDFEVVRFDRPPTDPYGSDARPTGGDPRPPGNDAPPPGPLDPPFPMGDPAPTEAVDDPVQLVHLDLPDFDPSHVDWSDFDAGEAGELGPYGPDIDTTVTPDDDLASAAAATAGDTDGAHDDGDKQDLPAATIPAPRAAQDPAPRAAQDPALPKPGQGPTAPDSQKEQSSAAPSPRTGRPWDWDPPSGRSRTTEPGTPESPSSSADAAPPADAAPVAEQVDVPAGPWQGAPTRSRGSGAAQGDRPSTPSQAPAGAAETVMPVTDLDRAQRFYVRLLGFDPLSASAAEVVLENGNTRICLRREPDPTLLGTGTLRVQVLDLEAAVGRLRANGVEITRPPAPLKDVEDLWLAQVHDPDGNTVWMVQRRQRP